MKLSLPALAGLTLALVPAIIVANAGVAFAQASPAPAGSSMPAPSPMASAMASAMPAPSPMASAMASAMPAPSPMASAMASAMPAPSPMASAMASSMPAPAPSASAKAPSMPAPMSTSAPSATTTGSPATVPGASQPAAPAPGASGAPAAAAPPEDVLSRITINVAPLYSFGTAGDDAPAPTPGRTVHLGYTTQHRNSDDLRIDYGADLKLTSRTHLSYSHGNIAYQLGRILIGTTTELSSGDLVDYTDTYSLSHSLGGGLGVHVTYFNHQRSFGTFTAAPPFCLNSKTCGGVANPSSIDERGYTFGGSLDFGPTSKIGKIFNAAFDLKYIPRPSTPNDPATVALGGLGAYKGSQVLYPYSFTVKLPITNSSTFIPFVNYTNLPVLYRDSAVPEAYRGIVFGFAKVISKNATLSYTNLNLQSCRCIARVPPPDNLRLTLGILKLDLHTGL